MSPARRSAGSRRGRLGRSPWAGSRAARGSRGGRTGGRSLRHPCERRELLGSHVGRPEAPGRIERFGTHVSRVRAVLARLTTGHRSLDVHPTVLHVDGAPVAVADVTGGPPTVWRGRSESGKAFDRGHDV